MDVLIRRLSAMGSPFSSRPKSFQSSGAMTSLSAMPSPTVMACAGRRVDCVSDVTSIIRRGDPRFRFCLPRGWYGRRHAARRVLLVVDAAVEDVLVRRVVVDLRGPSASSTAVLYFAETRKPALPLLRGSAL